MEPVQKTAQKEVTDWAVQNDNKPLWTRSPREVRPSQHPLPTAHLFLVPFERTHFLQLASLPL